MRILLSTLPIILMVATSFAQIKLHVDGDAYVRNKLLLHPSVSSTGEYIVNTDGLTLSFFTKFEERMKILNTGQVQIFQMDTIFGEAARLVRRTDGTISAHRYRIGDFVHGGVVFWVDESGEHGLVVDKEDIADSLRWNNAHQNRTSATGSGFGAGEMNTALIIAALQSDSFPVEMAAYSCATLDTEGYADWYLPSKEELNQIYKQRNIVDEVSLFHDGSQLSAGSYWTSNESTNSDNDAEAKAWSQDFSSGTQSENNKYDTYAVRAVRKF